MRSPRLDYNLGCIGEGDEVGKMKGEPAMKGEVEAGGEIIIQAKLSHRERKERSRSLIYAPNLVLFCGILQYLFDFHINNNPCFPSFEFILFSGRLGTNSGRIWDTAHLRIKHELCYTQTLGVNVN